MSNGSVSPLNSKKPYMYILYESLKTLNYIHIHNIFTHAYDFVELQGEKYNWTCSLLVLLILPCRGGPTIAYDPIVGQL